jgi:Ser/Thr protein kinase RdoA (MazF antagonist)
MRRELDAINAARSIVPVAKVLSVNFDDCVVQFARVLAAPGQELLESGLGGAVMFAAGKALARLHRSLGGTLAHGDYGPHNLLFTVDARTIVLVSDWEFSEVDGSLVSDLAWAEWIVRMHHPAQVACITQLFAGYEARPQWSERLTAMVDKCAGFSARARQDGRLSTQRLWDERERDNFGVGGRCGRLGADPSQRCLSGSVPHGDP